MNRFRGKGIQGFTLVETVLCITLGATVFGVTVGFLATAMRVDSDDRSAGAGGLATSSASSATLDRLAEQLRSDVHAAIGATPVSSEGAKAHWTLSLPEDQRIEYSVESHALLRTEYIANKFRARDAFWLPPDLTIRWQASFAENRGGGKQAAGDRAMVSLFLDSSEQFGPAATNTAAPALRIDAAMGSDRKYISTASK